MQCNKSPLHSGGISFDKSLHFNHKVGFDFLSKCKSAKPSFLCGHFLKKLSTFIYEELNTSTPPAVLLFCYNVRHLAIWRLHIPAKLKQEGQKYIFQFSRCESFHLVIQMSLVFCVNRCPHPASFISIS